MPPATTTTVEDTAATGTPQVVTITADTSPVTEGTAATFTITADPAPTTAITVSVDIGEDGNVLSGTPPSTVTISTTGQATLTVATDDDQIDEPNSEVTAKLQGGTGYAIGTPSSAAVTVEDNDISPPGTPQVTISADTSPVTEGTAATFTITANSCTHNRNNRERERHRGQKMSSAAHRTKQSPSTPMRPPPH